MPAWPPMPAQSEAPRRSLSLEFWSCAALAHGQATASIAAQKFDDVECGAKNKACLASTPQGRSALGIGGLGEWSLCAGDVLNLPKAPNLRLSPPSFANRIVLHAKLPTPMAPVTP